MKPTVSVVLVLLSGAATVAAQNPTAHPDQCKDAAEIRRALEDWVEATNAGQRLRVATMWAEDLIGWYPGRPDDTFERQMEAAHRLDGVKPAVRVDLIINEILVSGDLAVVRDTWGFTREAPTSTTRTTLRGFEVWRKQPDGKWKISRWISAPEPETK